MTMHFHIGAYWNGVLVLDGNMTGVMAFEVARHCQRDNFAGTTRKAFDLTLDKVMAMRNGDRLDLKNGDETGRSHVIIRKS
jgi:hypothetical protein